MLQQIIFWLVLLIAFLGIELATMGLTTVWFAGGALVALIAAFFHAPIIVQIVLFFLVTFVLLFFTRPIAVKYFNADRVRTNVESMVGKKAVVTEEIDNLQSKGTVIVNGQEWSARSRMAEKKIPVGAVVAVAAVSGVRLIVSEEDGGDAPAAEKAVL